MSRLPPLPPGYVAQPAWLREDDDRAFELNRVYDPDGRLDFASSFWLVTPLHLGDAPPLESVSYGAVARLHDLPFGEFAALTVSTAQIDRWIAEARRPLPRQGIPRLVPRKV